MLEYGWKIQILMKEKIQGMEIAEMHFLTAGRRKRTAVYILTENKLC